MSTVPHQWRFRFLANTRHDISDVRCPLRQLLSSSAFRRALLFAIVIVYVAVQVHSALTVEYPLCVEQNDAEVVSVLCK
jgi:hypothetical protein